MTVHNEKLAAARELLGADFYDLSQIDAQKKSVVDAQFSIRHGRYVASGTMRCAQEIMAAAQARQLPSPTPPSLMLAKGEVETKLYGIPTLDKHEAFLTLEWEESGRYVEANMMRILQDKQIEIPSGTRMIIKVRHSEHPKYGHCVELNWEGNCFLPINEVENDQEEEKEQTE